MIRKADVVDKGVEVYNVPGAGGTIGLSQLSSKQSGESNELMVMGLVMLGAIQTNKSPVDLTKTTPIATLTTEPEAIVVPARSRRTRRSRTSCEDMKADPGKFSVGGGSAGGTDQILLGLLAKAAGVDPSKLKYVAYSGGGEALQSILSGSVDAGVSGVSEFADQVEAGKMRVLAVSGAERRRGRRQAREVDLRAGPTTWRSRTGAASSAPPEIKPAERDAAIEAIEKMHDSPRVAGRARSRTAGMTSSRPATTFESLHRLARTSASRASSPRSGSRG